MSKQIIMLLTSAARSNSTDLAAIKEPHSNRNARLQRLLQQSAQIAGRFHAEITQKYRAAPIQEYRPVSNLKVLTVRA